MSSDKDKAKYLLWVDLETTGLPEVHPNVIDFTDVHLMEMGAIITDTSLNIIDNMAYTEVVKMNPDIANALRANDFVREMHQKNGLIRDCLKATDTMEEIDAAVSEMMGEMGVKPGEFALAGSGIAAFDLPFIRTKMPQISEWLAYFPYDIGVFRRLMRSLAGRSVVNPNLSSFGNDKLHRAFADVKAHLDEAITYRTWARDPYTEEPPY